MHLETFSHSSTGWSMPFPDMDSEQTLVIVFGAREYSETPAPILELISAYPKSHIVGCSSSGEIFGTEIFDKSLSVAIARFEKASLRTTLAHIERPEESYACGERIANDLNADGLRGVMILSDGIHVNGSDLVRGLNAVFPESVIVTGGLAGDGARFEQTWVIAEGAPVSGAITAVGLYGDSVVLGHGSKGGWDIFGPQRIVTRSKDNVLFELDREPALTLYKKYLGERASGLPATALLFPLQIWPSDNDPDKVLVRTVLAVSEEDQSLTFAGDIPEGARVQFMKANFDRLVQGAEEAAGMAHQRLRGTGATLSVAISCVGRRLVLGERTEEETEATLEALPPGTKQIGFYSYGEISPFASGRCDLHNQTMTLTTISEAS